MSEIVWVDKQYKEYTIDEITDQHLKNILGLLSRGGGYVDLITNNMVEQLFVESIKRGIKHEYSIINIINILEDRRFASEINYLNTLN